MIELKDYQQDFDFTYQFNNNGDVYGSDHHHFPYIHNPDQIHCQRLHPIIDVTDLNQYCITQIKILVRPDHRDPLKYILNTHYGHDYTITTSDIDMVDIMAKGINKAQGALLIAKHYGLTMEDIYAAGDGENDICLFETFKHHCVMDSAEISARSKAKIACGSVAEAIRMWLDQG